MDDKLWEKREAPVPSDSCSCGGYLVHDYVNGDVICSECGFCQIDTILEAREEYEGFDRNENYKLVMKNTYKVAHHVNEKLSQLRCLDTPLTEEQEFFIRQYTAPPQVWANIIHPTDAKDTIRKVIHQIRKDPVGKKHFFPRHQEKWILIRFLLTGLKPTIPDNFVTRVQDSFDQIEHALRNFEKASNKKTSFLNYNFVFRCIIQKYYDEDVQKELFPYFPLLKGKDKLKNLKRILTLIFEYLRWPLIPCLVG